MELSSRRKLSEPAIGGGSNIGPMIGVSAPWIVPAITAVISPAIGRIVAAITVVSASVAVRIAIPIRVTRVGIIVVIIVAAVGVWRRGC